MRLFCNQNFKLLFFDDKNVKNKFFLKNIDSTLKCSEND